MVIYCGSLSLNFILSSKKDGIGYLSPLGDAEEGSEIFLSTIGCLPDKGIVGFPELTSCTLEAPAVDKFIFSI